MTDKLSNKVVSHLFVLIVLSITGCGGGGSSSDSADDFSRSSQAVSGSGVKGPLAHADVSVYTLDTTQSDFKGATVATATTNTAAAITGLALPFPLNPPYLLEFTSNQATTDLTTGQSPVITTLRSVITQEMLAASKQIYATPLTTMAVDLAIAKADSVDSPFTGNGDGRVSNAEFSAALPVAASQVASTVGFGLDSSVDIFDTPPMIDGTTDTIAEQEAVAAYRAAVEALSAVVFEIHQQGLGGSPEAVLSELTADLADGEIDGVVHGSNSAIITTQALIVLASNPSLLPIPNSNDGNGHPILVGEVNRLLSDETSETGAQVDTTSLRDGTIEISLQPATNHPDIDGDGTPNAEDAFPTNPAESVDADGDGIGNGADDDDDNDGVSDGSDPDPQDSSESGETVEGGTDSPTSSSLSMSLTPEGSDPSSLEGDAVSGDIYVFVSSESDITEVRFYLDGTLVRTERNAPYSFSSDANGLLNPFDTAQLTVGAHVISAEVDMSNGVTEVLTANFTIDAPNTAPFDPVLTLTWDPNPEKEVIGYEVYYSLTPSAKENDLIFKEDLSVGKSGFVLSTPQVIYSALKDIGLQQGSICFAVKAYSNTEKSDFSEIVCDTI